MILPHIRHNRSRALITASALLTGLSLSLGSCSNTIEPPPADPNAEFYMPTPGGGSPIGTQMGGAVGVLIDTTQPASAHCSVTFIDPIHAITAAHCLQRGTNPGRYQVSAMSPVSQPLTGTPVQQLYLHPNWDGDTSLVTNHLYAVTGTGGGEPPLQTTPLYDIAVIKLSAPTSGALLMRSGPLPATDGRVSFSSVYFNLGLNGEARGSEALAATDVRPSSFTSLMPSTTQSTLGGAAAIISNATVPGSGEILIGVFAGGAPSLGAVYTRIDAHRQFISDAIAGITTGNYTVDHNALNNPTNPGGPGTFDCAQSSDNFCDYACEGDIDCQMPEEVKLAPFGTPCTASSDCLSGVCLMFDERNTRCSAYCGGQQGSCPTGFECRAAVSGNLVCGTPLTETGDLPPPPALSYFGADCTSDAQCATNACINYNGERWCSERCRQNSDCPLSYICGEVTGGRGCVPPSSTPSTPPSGGTTPPAGGTTPPSGGTTPPSGGSGGSGG